MGFVRDFRIVAAAAAAALAVALGALGASPARAEDKHTIKIKEFADVGKTQIARDERRTANHIKVTDDTGKVLQEKNDKGAEVKEVEETTLETGPKKRTKWKSTINKLVRSLNGTDRPASYQGRTVVYTRSKEGKYEVAAEGGAPLTVPESMELVGPMNRPGRNDDDSPIDFILPKNPVAAGESWPIDLAKVPFITEMGAAADAAAGKGEGKLLKVFDKDGAKWGTLEIRFNVPLKGVPNAPAVKLTEPGAFEMTMRFEAPIDGSAHLGTMDTAVRMAVKGGVEQGGKKISLEITTEITGKSEYTDKK
jgi:hypothetical protein